MPYTKVRIVTLMKYQTKPRRLLGTITFYVLTKPLFMKRSLILLPFFALIFCCNSNDDSSPQPPDADNFYALTVGNEWVYQNNKYNPGTDNYLDTGVIDSVSIVGTETFNGKTYYRFRTYTTGNEEHITFCNPNGEHFELLRDSLGYLVRSDGSIKFTNSDYEERMVSTNAGITIYETLQPNLTDVVVGPVTFTGMYSERYARDADGGQLPGIDTFVYVDGTGLVYDTSSFVSQSLPSITRVLISHTVQ